MRRPIFFMHIGKTAGSYLNSVFEAALGKDKVITHFEYGGDPEKLRRHLSEGRVFFSGHIYLPSWMALQQKAGVEAQIVTMLRDPVERMASQIRWLDHYNEKAGVLRLDKDIVDLVRRIADIDITDAESLDGFLSTLSARGVEQLVNSQSRYFLGGQPDAPYPKDLPLDLTFRPAVEAALRRLDFIATNDELDAQLSALGTKLGVPLASLPQRVNVSPATRVIDTSDPDIREALGRRLRLDNWLWQRVGGQGKMRRLLARIVAQSR